MARAQDLYDLPAWQLAHEMDLRVDLFLGCPEFRGRFKSCNQLREAAISAPRSIADGYARPQQFAEFVRSARSSEAQVLQHLIDARQQRLITADELDINHWLARRAMKAALVLIRRLESTS